MVQDSATTVSNMCVECGCESLGSETGIIPVTITDVSRDGESGLTLDMTSTPEQTRQFINE
jgi:hypothetical protein